MQQQAVFLKLFRFASPVLVLVLLSTVIVFFKNII